MVDPLGDDELAVLRRLDAALTSAREGGGLVDPVQKPLALLDAYFEGVQRIPLLGITLPEQMRGLETVIGWPETVVTALEHRLDGEGFRIGSAESDDSGLWDIWQANNLDDEASQCHEDALVYGRSYVVVGGGDDGHTPVITVESPHEVIHDVDPRTRQVRAALRRWSDKDASGATEFATLWLPDETVQLELGARSQWQVTDRDPHGLGAVPVTPMVFGQRGKRPLGRSHMLKAMGIADAVCRAATNAQAATELLAVPTRYALGVARDKMIDANGQQIPLWQFYLGAIWTSENESAKLGQFPAADLRNFDVIISTWAKLLSGLYGLPIRYFGEATSNPPSEGSIVADESRLIKQAERTQKTFGGRWERAMRIAAAIEAKKRPDEMKTLDALEMRWRDAATPTRAQTTDSVTKLWATGRYPTRAGLEDMGKSEVEINRIMAQLQQEQADAMRAGFDALNEPPTPPQDGQQPPEGGPGVTGADAGAAGA